LFCFGFFGVLAFLSTGRTSFDDGIADATTRLKRPHATLGR
jgi:hypothetical protein